jgi:hypothetical protein
MDMEENLKAVFCHYCGKYQEENTSYFPPAMYRRWKVGYSVIRVCNPAAKPNCSNSMIEDGYSFIVPE